MISDGWLLGCGLFGLERWGIFVRVAVVEQYGGQGVVQGEGGMEDGAHLVGVHALACQPEAVRLSQTGSGCVQAVLPVA